jgi:hypothetical protein
MNATSTSRFAVLSLVALGLLCVAGSHDHASAAKPTGADKAWIDTCAADRQQANFKPAALRKYCKCMQAVVDNDEPFENITALERTYPPAHRDCHRAAGLT